jgi:hypothetical protein
MLDLKKKNIAVGCLKATDQLCNLKKNSKLKKASTLIYATRCLTNALVMESPKNCL